MMDFIIFSVQILRDLQGGLSRFWTTSLLPKILKG